MVKRAFLLIFMAFIGFSYAEAQVEDIMCLKEDLNTLYSTLRKNYPSLYRYGDSTYIDSVFRQSEAAIQKWPTELELYKQVKYILGSIKDGHLSSRPSPALDSLFRQQAKYFPVKLYLNSNGAVYVDSTVGGILLPRTRIYLIDGKSFHHIYRELYPYLVADGCSATGKAVLLNEMFYFYYWLVYGEKDAFSIVYEVAKDWDATINVNKLPLNELPKARADTTADTSLRLRFEEGVAILTISTFDHSQLQEQGLDFRPFIDSVFKEIKRRKTSKLIIDLRRNGGGRDLYGSLLYSYLTDKPFRYYKSLQAATKQLPYDMLSPAVSSFELSPDRLYPDSMGYFTLDTLAHPNLRVIQPAPNNYQGKVWFLIDGASFSTTAEFCAVARSHNRGVFVGEETGGAYEGNTSGAMMQVILPNTGIAVNYGAIRYTMDVKPAAKKGRGVIPDIEVVRTNETYDIQLQVALKLALSARRK